MINDMLENCHRCHRRPERLEILAAGWHVFWLVRCSCVTTLLWVVGDGSPIEVGLGAETSGVKVSASR